MLEHPPWARCLALMQQPCQANDSRKSYADLLASLPGDGEAHQFNDRCSPVGTCTATESSIKEVAMKRHLGLLAASALLVTMSLGVMAQPAMESPVARNALLTIDQNRSTVVDRIVGKWGEALTGSDAMMSS